MPLQKLGFGLLALASFFLYSRVFDLVLMSLHLTLIMYVLSITAAVFLGGLPRAFNHRIGRLMAALHVWMIVCLPFSVWITGSLETLQSAGFALGVYFITAGLIVNYSQYRRMVHVLALSILTLAVLTVPFHKEVDGRIFPEQGRFANPNDFAQVILIVLPLWWYLARDPVSARPRRVLAFLSLLFLLFMMSKTGSRGTMIGLFATGLVLFFKSSPRFRAKLVAVAFVFGAIAVVLLPGNLRSRYLTFLEADQEVVTPQPDSSGQEGEPVEAAAQSARSRRDLLIDSLSVTIRHPIFGVGPGMFAVGREEMAKIEQRWVRFQTTHNTYTQLSSEVGIPGLLLYLGVLLYSFKACRVQVPPELRQHPRVAGISQAGFTLQLALIAFAVSALFSSFAYAVFVPTLAGLAAAFERTSSAELAACLPQPAPASRPVPAQRGTRMAVRSGRPIR